MMSEKRIDPRRLLISGLRATSSLVVVGRRKRHLSAA
jgi:hypothetical protein